ncbi:MAG TPA: ribosome maturation factor RimP [Oscillospiraceae bacterium]|nr:ribosome maturation factor RimP [Oscillospiraceae bacterium]
MANSKNTVEKAYDLAKPLAESLGVSLWDVVFEKEGASWYLRIFIDKDDGINIDDCEAFSRPFNKILDEKDFIDQSYIFEVGSPGMGRELKRPEHFNKYIGSPVRARLIRAADGLKEITGVLKEYNKESILVDEKEIKLSDVAFVKLYDDENIFDE